MGGRRREGQGAGKLCQAGSDDDDVFIIITMLRCSAGRELRLTGDAFSARKSILRGDRK